MKKFLIVLSIFLNLVINVSGNTSALPGNHIITQEIRYISPDAAKVFIVWGLNNWNLPDSGLPEDGSFIKDKLVYTPMKKTPYGFTVNINVPVNTIVDFDFRITQGPAQKVVDVWDVNKPPQKDYHVSVVKNNTLLIESTVKARSKEALSILDFAVPILTISIVSFFLLVLLIRFLGNTTTRPGPANIIISASIVLVFVLVLLRASVTGFSWDLYLNPFESFQKVLWSGFYDVVYVSILACSFLILLKLFKNLKFRYLLICLFVCIALLSLIAGIMNIRVIETIGRPFDYAWFYYSDFLKSSEAREAFSSKMTFDYSLQIFMICLSTFFSGMMVSMLNDLIMQKIKRKYVLPSALLFISVSYLIIAPMAIKYNNWEYEKLANPFVAFSSSINPFSKDPELFTMNVADSLKFEPRKKRSFPSVSKMGIKNVIVFVLESTPAEYVQPYSSRFKITPELEKYLPESIVFENIYAHAPATNNSLVSILGSIYPWLSYNSITKEYPDIKMPTLSSELKKHGYETAFFNSADNRFQKADEFLKNRKFDEIIDCNSNQCKEGFEYTDEKRNYLDGKDDECTAEDMTAWIKNKSGKPFFAMMWTYQTHYPYFLSGEEKQYVSSDPDFNRYLNAVHHNDFVLGKIINELKQNGLYESTLVVVVGDHGEAFGRHNQTAHASGIYEENLHVPCIFINPAFKGEQRPVIGGLIDLAPTIMSQLGYEGSALWQGKDLFTENDNDRVYFFTPWADYLFGYREGNKKYIFNATKNITEIYDLKNDPYETNNLAVEFPELTAICHQRIAGWVQSHNQYINLLLANRSTK